MRLITVAMCMHILGCIPTSDWSLAGCGLDVAAPYVIAVTGSEKGWHVRYPGNTVANFVADEGLLLKGIHVPYDTTIVFELTSEDYVYAFTIRKQGIKELAIPGLKFSAEFRPLSTGSFELTSEELCGDPHPELQGQLIVEPRPQFLQWLRKKCEQTHGRRSIQDTEI